MAYNIKYIAAILSLLPLTAGCEDASPLLMTPPGLVVVVPIGAVLAATDVNEVIQPVRVETSGGEQLTPRFEGKASAVYKTNASTVICTGQHDLTELTYKPKEELYRKIALTCNRGFKGMAIFWRRSESEAPEITANVSVGPKSIPLRQIGRPGNYTLGDWSFDCTGEYVVRDQDVAPFGLGCAASAGRNLHGEILGAMAQVGTDDSLDRFTVWIFASQ